MPGRIIMTDTRVPSRSRKEKASRLTVELYADGQHDDRRQEAEPHKQDAWGRDESENQQGLRADCYIMKLRDRALGFRDNQGNVCTACKDCGWEQTNKKKQTSKQHCVLCQNNHLSPSETNDLQPACDSSCHRSKALLFSVFYAAL